MTLQTDVRKARRTDARMAGWTGGGWWGGVYNNIPAFSLKSAGIIMVTSPNIF